LCCDEEGCEEYMYQNGLLLTGFSDQKYYKNGLLFTGFMTIDGKKTYFYKGAQ